ncbi:MAG: hypothetical protein JW751_07405 [Polyangiaceae bacterium]|nr:hypothetical protein [Polyangiaceae bacterium]
MPILARLLCVSVLATSVACERPAGPRTAGPTSGSPPSSEHPTAPEAAPHILHSSAEIGAPKTAPPSSASAARSLTLAPLAERYPWLTEKDADNTTALDARFAPPVGFSRILVPTGSFGAWLRSLPLAPADTPVRDYLGSVRYPVRESRILAVSSLDLSPVDLQQCADTVIRLHAEWRWAAGYRDHSYRAAAGTELPFQRFVAGERVVGDGPRLTWQRGRARLADHAALRAYLDMVFAWANTGSLARDARIVPASEIRPGDFFVLPGNPGHAVLVLDLARSSVGGLRALIGQSYMPAQSFYVLRGPDSGWFPLDPPAKLHTPFWVPFPWSALRRLDPP